MDGIFHSLSAPLDVEIGIKLMEKVNWRAAVMQLGSTDLGADS